MEYKNIINNLNRPSVPPFKLKRFVSASSQSETEYSNQDNTPTFIHAESGARISNFYSDLCESRVNNNHRNVSSYDDDDVIICDDDDVIICEVPVKKKKKLTNASQDVIFESGHERIINRAMKFAQCDEVENLKCLIEDGLSVNTTDNFGWSLLMVASYAGSKSVVKYLISKGARRGKRDGKGNTALYLASKMNHVHIVKLLIKNNKGSAENDVRPVEEDFVEQGTEPQLCEICTITPTCSSREHETSIAHLFRLGPGNTRSMYCIPRSNVGFQMLLQQGWKDTEGLGPEGKGHKYPIKMKEKKDRLGIGHNPKNKNLKSSHKEKTESISQPNNNNNKQLEKQKEKYFRKMLNEPDILN